MESFLAWNCKKGFFEIRLTTYAEFKVLEKGWKHSIEFIQYQTRDICFHAIAPHRSKNSHIHKPSDLWKIGDEIKTSNIRPLTAYEKRQRRLERKHLSQELKQKGIELTIV